jgi:hypothetical protein
MAGTHLLLGSFDLLNIGHLTQFDAVAQADSHVVAAVISDDGVAALSGSAPFLPAAERSAVVSQLRVVDSTCITAQRTAGPCQTMTSFTSMPGSGTFSLRRVSIFATLSQLSPRAFPRTLHCCLQSLAPS